MTNFCMMPVLSYLSSINKAYQKLTNTCSKSCYKCSLTSWMMKTQKNTGDDWLFTETFKKYYRPTAWYQWLHEIQCSCKYIKNKCTANTIFNMPQPFPFHEHTVSNSNLLTQNTFKLWVYVIGFFFFPS